MTAGPFPTKAMFQALQTQVRPPSPWAYQDHFLRDVADASTEGFTVSGTGTARIAKDTPGSLGALILETADGQQGGVSAQLAQTFPALGEFEIRLGVTQTDPGVDATFEFGLFSTAANGAYLVAAVNLLGAGHFSGSTEWDTPIALGDWETVRIRLTSDGAEVIRSDGQTIALPLPYNWAVGAQPWTATFTVNAGAVAGHHAVGHLDAVAWRPLDAGTL